jgi:hypothetical protein
MDQTSEKRPSQLQRFIVVFGWWVVIIVLLPVYVHTAYPAPSANEYLFIRIAFAAAAAFVALLIPTFTRSLPFSSKAALVAAVASVIFAGFYLYTPASLVTLAPDQHVTTFTVCRGEYPNGCGNVDVNVGCGTPDQIVADRCSDPAKSTQLSSRDGNRCGYTIWQFSCHAKIKF